MRFSGFWDPNLSFQKMGIRALVWGGWADPGVLWKKALRAMRAVRGNALETLPFQPYLGAQKKFPQSTVKLVLPSNESYESKRGCNHTPAPDFGFH